VRLIDNERAFFSDRKSFHFPSGMAADGVVTPSGAILVAKMHNQNSAANPESEPIQPGKLTVSSMKGVCR